MSVFADVEVSRPPKALNIVYILFGYAVASVLLPRNADALTQVATTVLVGGILSTFFFYLKPVERTLFVFFVFMKRWEIRHGATWFNDKRFPDVTNSLTLLREVYNSPVIAFEKMSVTGAVFFSMSIMISGKGLDYVGLPQPFFVLLVASFPTLAIAIWESYTLWGRMHVLAAFYTFVHEGELESPFMSSLKKAIDGKDWFEARLIISSRLKRGAVLGVGGLCIKCNTIKSFGDHCEICGRRLLGYCPNCGNRLAGLSSFPKFCPYCGQSIPKK